VLSISREILTLSKTGDLPPRRDQIARGCFGRLRDGAPFRRHRLAESQIANHRKQEIEAHATRGCRHASRDSLVGPEFPRGFLELDVSQDSILVETGFDEPIAEIAPRHYPELGARESGRYAAPNEVGGTAGDTPVRPSERRHQQHLRREPLLGAGRDGRKSQDEKAASKHREGEGNFPTRPSEGPNDRRFSGAKIRYPRGVPRGYRFGAPFFGLTRVLEREFSNYCTTTCPDIADP
jgi:hypothetical protein